MKSKLVVLAVNLAWTVLTNIVLKKVTGRFMPVKI